MGETLVADLDQSHLTKGSPSYDFELFKICAFELQFIYSFNQWFDEFAELLLLFITGCVRIPDNQFQYN